MNDRTATFGLSWGASAEAALRRFVGLAPVEQADDLLVWSLPDLVDRLYAEGAFCPSVFRAAGPEDNVCLHFSGDALLVVDVRFRYPFETIGEDPDTLSDAAMAAVSRSELLALLQQFAAKYGAPHHFSEQPSRRGKVIGVSSLFYVLPDGSTISLWFGHDHAGPVGEMRYMCPSYDQAGF